MLERPQVGERAILVQLALPGLDAERALMEFKELALSAQAHVLNCVVGASTAIDAKYYVGLGKAEEIREQVILHEANLVLINHELSASQERNLERFLQCRVVGRSGLILDIFAQRARTFEGKLQVELALLKHLSTRLIRGWTHLERQKGGIGLRGPGETQLETDRRLLKARMQLINKRLDKVKNSRQQNRLSRLKASLHTVSLIGYTNAGKSTLFNILTKAASYTAHQLFATLDPSMRKIELPGSHPIILVDTVGFIRDLPHALIEAFSATLEETQEADLLIHVIDISDPNWRETVDTVERVLFEINSAHIPVIQVFNKIDLQDNWDSKSYHEDNVSKVWLSAKTGEGLSLLKELISEKLFHGFQKETIHLSAHQAKIRAKLYALQAVSQEKPDEQGGWYLEVKWSAPLKKSLME